MVGFPDDWGYSKLLWWKRHFSTNITEIICTIHALSLHPFWDLAKQPQHNILEIIYTAEEEFLKSAVNACTMQLHGSKWNTTSCTFQCLRAHCIIHLARWTASPFRWTATRLMQYLSDDGIIHFTLRVATSLLKPAQRQKQCTVYNLGPTPYLWNYNQLTVWSYTSSAPED